MLPGKQHHIEKEINYVSGDRKTRTELVFTTAIEYLNSIEKKDRNLIY